jgi:hypothetical protein
MSSRTGYEVVVSAAYPAAAALTATRAGHRLALRS